MALPVPQVSLVKLNIDELRGLPQQKLDIKFHETLSGLEAVKPVIGELCVAVSASGLYLTGRVKTLLKLECDTCLRPYFTALTVDIDERFTQEPRLKIDRGQDPKERELLRDDFVEPLPASGTLDISDVVYQAVTLATPTYFSCGKECPGPPAVQDSRSAHDSAHARAARKKSEAEPPIDPRWKNLKTLFPNEESKENS